jgi:hypothetical protein
MITPIPINPDLPSHFFNMLHMDRSEAEIKQWWDQPFAQRDSSGSLSVYCLDGGTEERPTFYGTAATVEEANELATRKLTEWRAFRSRPYITGDGATVSVVRNPQVPRGKVEILATFVDSKKAQEYIDRLDN